MKIKKIKNSKILITGGLGFVGSNLAKYLSKLNEVYVLDNMFTGKMINKSKNILGWKPKINFYRGLKKTIRSYISQT